MTPAEYITILLKFGLPYVTQLVIWYNQKDKKITPEDAAYLNSLAQYRSSDALAAAGIRIVDGRVVPADAPTP